MNSPQDIATRFLNLVIDGKIDEAYEQYVNPTGRHHNVFTPAGFEALKTGMKQAELQFPHKQFAIKAVVGGDPLVAIYSHLIMQPGEAGMAVVHIMRIVDGKITELWDCGQAIPKDSPNGDGPF